MRSTFWRLLLALLLAVALPMQGYAAHGLRLCGPEHPQAVPPASPHEHGGRGLHHDDGALAGDTSDAGDTAASASGDEHHAGAHEPHKAGKCSACSACCNVLAPPQSLPLLELPEQRPLAIATEPGVRDGLKLGGLDRPPQSLLA